jgi:hypothetical protein
MSRVPPTTRQAEIASKRLPVGVCSMKCA